jgi:hypothetical protein
LPAKQDHIDKADYSYDARYELQKFTPSNVADAANSFATVKTHIESIL